MGAKPFSEEIRWLSKSIYYQREKSCNLWHTCFYSTSYGGFLWLYVRRTAVIKHGINALKRQAECPSTNLDYFGKLSILCLQDVDVNDEHDP